MRIAIVILLLHATLASAALKELKILKREPFAGGAEFGNTGPYERIIGIARFAIDPKHAANMPIVDLDKAPTNADGMVEFEADVFILAPKDQSRGNGMLLYDVNNRGKKQALAFFNDAPVNQDPKSLEDAGTGFLMKQGYTIVWSGWIGELIPGDGRMLMKAPIATDNGKPITGKVRFEFSTDIKCDSLPLSRREGHGSYNPTAAGEKEGVLTWREKESDPRQPVSRDQWKLERLPIPQVKDSVPGTLQQVRCHLEGGYKPGVLYELICECENPIVQGVCFAVVRDLIAFLKYDATPANPIARKGYRAFAFGISQSARFLRHFLYERFNIDPQNRMVFDGLVPHVAGGGLGYFNHRFAQPTRHNAQHEDHTYPNDVFPFTYGNEQHTYYDNDNKIVKEDRIDGILKKYPPHLLPKVMHTQSSSEYWHRSGSLVHTDTLGTRDSPIPQNVRIYSFGGTQHGPATFPLQQDRGVNLQNPGNFKPIMRSLLVAMDDWTAGRKPPPDSEYPRIAGSRSLQSPEAAAKQFPKIPGVAFPLVVQQPPLADFGEQQKKGILSEPPTIRGHYRCLVPISWQKTGRELGMLDPPEVYMGLATHTGWNVRRKEYGAEGMLLPLMGSYIPRPRTDAVAEKAGDSRLSIVTDYENFANYRKCFRELCDEYVVKRWLLREDADRLVANVSLSHHLFIDPAESMLEPGTRMERIVDSCKFTEGPAVDKDGNLFFSDGANNRIMKFSTDGKLSEHLNPYGRTNGMAFDIDGRLVMCQSTTEGGKRRVARLEKDGTETPLAETFDGKRFYAPNDLCVDAKGRIYFTDMNVGKEKGEALASAVYRIDAPGKLVRVIDNLGRPNGIALSPDKKLLYVSDRSTQKLHRYKVTDDGALMPDGIVYDFSPDRGVDGMRLDEKGNIWAAAGEGKTTGLFVISPEGKLLLHHAVPEFSTNLCFGGKDNRDVYFTATKSVYKFRSTVPGVRLPGR